MDRFNALQLFTRIVELGSFTKAAGVLNIPRATATHAIKELEKRLGARLLDRTIRQVRPTLDGQAYNIKWLLRMIARKGIRPFFLSLFYALFTGASNINPASG